MRARSSIGCQLHRIPFPKSWIPATKAARILTHSFHSSPSSLSLLVLIIDNSSSSSISKMREIVHIQGGQCGNREFVWLNNESGHCYNLRRRYCPTVHPALPSSHPLQHSRLPISLLPPLVQRSVPSSGYVAVAIGSLPSCVSFCGMAWRRMVADRSRTDGLLFGEMVWMDTAPAVIGVSLCGPAVSLAEVAVSAVEIRRRRGGGG